MTNIFGEHQENTIAQFREIEARATRAALMADGHYGYVMPVGGVAAYNNQVSVVGVGFDIACGNAAIRTSLTLIDLVGFSRKDVDANPSLVSANAKLNALANKIASTISFGIGRTNLANDAPTDHPLFLSDSWYAIPNIGRYRDDLREKAQRQLGTVGSGNHYVDVFVDETDAIWVGVHFGSRGLGHTIASNYLAIGQGGTWGDRGKEIETLLDLSTQNGQEYWALMNLAGEYAYAGREWVARKVMSLIGGEEVELVHNHHNFAWKESHYTPIDAQGFQYAQEYVVIRKGATPAFPGQMGFVGGSMGDNAVILEGKRGKITPEQENTLFSTVHGAGRVMSRTEAAGKWDRRKRVQKTHGKISRTMMEEWLNREGVILRGGGMDEAPQAYRRLPEVLEAQGNTINVLHTLKPIVVVMAGAHEIDPYKD